MIEQIETVFQKGDLGVVKSFECSLGFNGSVIWEVNECDVTIAHFKTKKTAVLAIEMILDGRIDKTWDIGRQVFEWFFNNDPANIPKELDS